MDKVMGEHSAIYVTFVCLVCKRKFRIVTQIMGYYIQAKDILALNAGEYLKLYTKAFKAVGALNLDLAYVESQHHAF